MHTAAFSLPTRPKSNDATHVNKLGTRQDMQEEVRCVLVQTRMQEYEDWPASRALLCDSSGAESALDWLSLELPFAS